MNTPIPLFFQFADVCSCEAAQQSADPSVNLTKHVYTYSHVSFHARSNRALLIRAHASTVSRNGERVFSRIVGITTEIRDKRAGFLRSRPTAIVKNACVQRRSKCY